MPLYFLKPVVWNTLGYKRPSGAKFSSGYPAEHGFGLEEWNAAETSTTLVEGRSMRTFHTQGFGRQPLDDYPGDIFVFMIASNGGKQYLVGIAGGATALFSDNHRQKRREYSKNIVGGKDRWKEAWELPQVRRCHGDDVERFQSQWLDEEEYLANWICPPELFYWLEDPMLLNPHEISGKGSLVKMFSAHQPISREIASRIVAGIVPVKASVALDNIRAKLDSTLGDRITDVATLACDQSLDPTTRETLIQARLGQGKFRDSLIRLWHGECSVTGCNVPQVLIASHIQPWRKSDNRERMDPNNGLLLVATIDALFDSYLISFEDSGEMLISSSIPVMQRTMLGLPRGLRVLPNKEQCRYLAQHRESFARRLL